MRAFAWIVKSEIEGMIASGPGLSSEYVLPSGLVEKVDLLAGGTMYIIERGNKGDSLFARLCVARVEEFHDDACDETRYLLSIDLLRSARMFKSYGEESARDFTCDLFHEKQYGVSPITHDQVRDLESVVGNCMQNRFTAIPSTLLSRISMPAGPASKDGLAQFVLREVIRNCSMSEIWGGLKVRDPFVNTAICFAKANGMDVLREIVALKEIREISKLCAPAKKRPVSAQALEVDLNFIPIDENHIVVRRFIAADESLSLAESMAKTESAELRHQTILREVVIRLKSLGIKPFQTSSCDLVVFEKNAVRLFEIKSMTEANAGTQAAKGLFQLILYGRALRNAGYKVDEMAIIGEKIPTASTVKTIIETLSSVDVGYYVYDANQSWPERTIPSLSGIVPVTGLSQR